MFTDQKLADLYDTIHLHEADTPFYVDLVAELAPRDVVDLGCGTGRLALILASAGYRVTGIDPSPQMLNVARRKEGAETVRWVEGGAEALAEAEADLVLMTGHVAQFLVADDEWHDALRRIARALRPGGRLAFETRNPAARGWEEWTPESSRRVTELPEGTVETWSEVTSVSDGIVDGAFCCRFPTGEVVREHGPLVFRGLEEVTAALEEAGFEIERVYGDWDRSEVSPDSPEHIYVARRSAGVSPST